MAGIPAKLALEDGTVYTGRSFGATGETFGEVRDFADRGARQANDAYARFSNAAAQGQSALEDVFGRSTQAYQDYARKTVEIARENANAHFDS